MKDNHTDRPKPIMYFIGFVNTSWEVEYRRAIVEITVQTALDRESALDRATLLHVVTRSIDHTRAQFGIVSEYARAVCRFVNETFDLGLSMTVTDFQRGAVLGHLTRSMSDEEIVAHVEQHIQRRCGFIPDYADPLEGINLFEWLFWCAEAMEHGPGHIPGDEIYDHLSQDYYRTGGVLRNVRAALDTEKLEKLLARPVDAILERVLRGG